MSYGTKVDQDKVSQFVKGKTTYNEVIQRIGKPTNSTINADGTKTLTYSYMQHQMNPISFIPIVGLFARGGETEDTTVLLYFDSNSILTNYSASEGQYLRQKLRRFRMNPADFCGLENTVVH